MRIQHIGEVIYYLREKGGLSQQQLADGICTPKYIYLLEKGKNTPSAFILEQLSNKLHIDIFKYYMEVIRHFSFETHEKIVHINELLAEQNIRELFQYILVCEQSEEFHEGEPMQFLCYIKALAASHLENDQNKAYLYCMQGLSVHFQNFKLTDISNHHFTNIEYILLNCIACYLKPSCTTQNSARILTAVKNNLDFILSDSRYSIYTYYHFHANYYGTVTYNLSEYQIELQLYQEALKTVEDGISVCLKTGFTQELPALLENKYIAYYKLNNFEQAKITYEQTKVLYEVYGEQDALKKIIKKTEELYPELLQPS